MASPEVRVRVWLPWYGRAILSVACGLAKLRCEWLAVQLGSLSVRFLRTEVEE